MRHRICGVRPGWVRIILVLWTAGLFLTTVCAAAPDCSQLPPPDPKKNFFANFVNGCYAIPLAPGTEGSLGGDLNAKYGTIYYRVNPGYELIFFGVFPHSRYIAITGYDDHEAVTGSLTDRNIVPISSLVANPFQPGVPFRENQYYGVVVSFGGTPPAKSAVAPGCDLDMFNVRVNQIDVSRRHTGMDWNGDPTVPPGFPVHESGANTAGAVMFRNYLEEATASPLSKPVVLLRDLSTGCAVSSAQAIQLLGIVTLNRAVYQTWLHQDQALGHIQYANSILPKMCYLQDPAEALVWYRSPDYVSVGNADTAYLLAQLPSLNPPPADMFIRMRFRVATVARIPCDTGCTLNGTEQLRYWSLSFDYLSTPLQVLVGAGTTVASLSDRDLVADPQGHVTLVLGLGTPPPAWVTPANGYTFFDLSAVPNFQKVSMLHIRNILPAPDFPCAANNVGFLTGEWNSLGGFIGEYGPFVDYLSSSGIPQQAIPNDRPNFCGAVPPETAMACPTLAPMPFPGR